MTRQRYVAELLRLYSEAPGTPSQPTRRDRDLADDLYRQGVPLARFAHAIRLATLRRHLGQPARHQAIHSLAYFSTVSNRLCEDELEPGYVHYVERRYLNICQQLPQYKTRPSRQNPALRGRR